MRFPSDCESTRGARALPFLRAAVLTLVAATLPGCGRPAPEPADPIPLAGLSLEPHALGGIALPEFGIENLEGNDWFLISADKWVKMRGQRGHLSFWVGEPSELELGLRLRRALFLPEDLEVEVFVNGTSAAIGTVGKKASWLRFDVDDSILRPGTNRMRIETSGSGSPKDYLEGNGDTRELSIELSELQVGESVAQPIATGEPIELAPGAGLSVELSPTQESKLVVEASGGELWVGLRDVGTNGALDWQSYPLGAEPTALDLEVHHLDGRVVEVSLAAARDGAPVVIHGIESATRPAIDVLLIIVDTLRADAFTGFGVEQPLPAFTRLIRDGAPFANCFSHAPMTLPSHTALFSSRTPSLSGVTNNWQTVPTELPLFAEWLSAAGFETRASISLGTLWTPMPGGGLERGFDQYLSTQDMLRGPDVVERAVPILEGLDPDLPSFVFAHYCDPHEPYNSRGVGPRYCSLTTPDGRSLKLQLNEWTKTEIEVDFERGEPVVFESEHEFKLRELRAFVGDKRKPITYLTEQGQGAVAKRFEAQVDASGPGRLEVWVHDRPKSRLEFQQRYAEEVVYADRFVGQLLDALDAAGTYDDTLIVFTSDHGEQLGEHNHVGHARYLYDPEIHVPLVIKPPKRMVEALETLRTKRDAVVRHMDVVPTVLDLLDLPPLPGAVGRSLLEDAERLHLAETYQPESPKNLLALRDDGHKLVYVPEDDAFELYDLQADPLEQTNLWDQKGAEFQEWATDLKTLASGAGETMRLEDMDAATRERLQKLGYGEGGDSQS
ncbi:MAG: sulfatase [Planctomycetota bacterium]